MSFENLNQSLGVFFKNQLEKRGVWLKIFLIALGVMVLLNLVLIKPSHGAEVSGHGEATHEVHAEPAHDVHAESAHAASGHGEEAAHGGHGAAHPMEDMKTGERALVHYYPTGAHTYETTKWAEDNFIVKYIVLAFHYIHEWENIPGFWAVFGVFFAVLLTRVAKGAAHTFLGKPEDFYDR